MKKRVFGLVTWLKQPAHLHDYTYKNFWTCSLKYVYVSLIREPLYSNRAVIAWWLQSTSAQNRIKVSYIGQCFTSENIRHKLLSLINPAVYLFNKIFMG